jgi:opacity protein-like surface antigen
MKKNRWMMLAMVGLVAVASPAIAQDVSGIYLGASGGYAWHKDACKNQPIPCGSTDPAVRLFAGYRFNSAVSLEGAYAHLGEVEGAGTVPAGDARLFRQVNSWDASGVFAVPIAGRLNGLGKLGVYRARTKRDFTVAGAAEHFGGTNSGFTYGAGLGYDLGRIGVRAEWQRWENVGTSSTGEDDVDVLSLGLLFRF